MISRWTSDDEIKTCQPANYALLHNKLAGFVLWSSILEANCVLISGVNFIRSHGLNHRQFNWFIEAEHGAISYHTDVRWLSIGTVFNRHVEINDVLNEN